MCYNSFYGPVSTSDVTHSMCHRAEGVNSGCPSVRTEGKTPVKPGVLLERFIPGFKSWCNIGRDN